MKPLNRVAYYGDPLACAYKPTTYGDGSSRDRWLHRWAAACDVLRDRVHAAATLTASLYAAHRFARALDRYIVAALRCGVRLPAGRWLNTANATRSLDRLIAERKARSS